MKPISRIIKEMDELLKPEIELAKKLDEHYWQKGYPKLENQLKNKIRTQAIAIVKACIDEIKDFYVKLPPQTENLINNCPKCGQEVNRDFVEMKVKEIMHSALTQVIEKLKEEIKSL